MLTGNVRGAAMLDELQNFEIKISDEGHNSFNAKIGAHDDLLISLGLAARTAEQSGEHI
jgi:hypothetical protein